MKIAVEEERKARGWGSEAEGSADEGILVMCNKQ